MATPKIAPPTNVVPDTSTSSAYDPYTDNTPVYIGGASWLGPALGLDKQTYDTNVHHGEPTSDGPGGSSQLNATTTTVGQLNTLWYTTMTNGQKLALARKMWSLGYKDVTSPTDINGAQTVWTQAVQQSSMYYTKGNQKVSPLDWLDQNSIANQALLKARAEAGPGGITQTKNVDLTDITHVKALATTAMEQAMGRAPTQSEINTFFNTVQAAEKNTPQTVTRDLNSDGSQVNGSGTVVQDSVDPSDIIKQMLEKDPEARGYQAVSTYMGALQQALGAPGSGLTNAGADLG